MYRANKQLNRDYHTLKSEGTSFLDVVVVDEEEIDGVFFFLTGETFCTSLIGLLLVLASDVKAAAALIGVVFPAPFALSARTDR